MRLCMCESVCVCVCVCMCECVCAHGSCTCVHTCACMCVHCILPPLRPLPVLTMTEWSGDSPVDPILLPLPTHLPLCHSARLRQRHRRLAVRAPHCWSCLSSSRGDRRGKLFHIKKEATGFDFEHIFVLKAKTAPGVC